MILYNIIKLIIRIIYYAIILLYMVSNILTDNILYKYNNQIFKEYHYIMLIPYLIYIIIVSLYFKLLYNNISYYVQEIIMYEFYYTDIYTSIIFIDYLTIICYILFTFNLYRHYIDNNVNNEINNEINILYIQRILLHIIIILYYHISKYVVNTYFTDNIIIDEMIDF